MQDYIRLGYLGLTTHEVNVMKCIFNLSPELKESYHLTGASELEKADLVLVNVDDQQAINQWHNITRINKLATPMTLSAKGKTIDGAIPLTLPIRLNKLIQALKDVVKENTQFNIPGSTSTTEMPLQILVVDDSYPVRKYMEQKVAELVKAPIRLSFAESGEEAMIKFKNRTFDLVFLDVMMEGADGYKVCKEIKAKHSSTVVMLTSKKSPFDKVRGTMSGCDAYITKPPADERLVEEIQKCVEKRSVAQYKTTQMKSAAA